MQHRYGGEVERVAGVVVERADAALTEDDVLVAAGHDVLRTHQQLLERVGKAALEQDRLFHRPQLLEQVVVLHVARTDLDDVDVVKQRQVLTVHQLRHDGQTRLALGRLEKAQPQLVQPLKIIRRGAGLERAAAQHLRARGLDGLRHGHDLLLRLHGARPCDHGEVSAAELCLPHGDNRVIRVELPVAAFEGVGDGLYAVHDLQTLQQGRVETARVADQAEDGLRPAERRVYAQPLPRQPVRQLALLLLTDTRFQYNNHG